MMSLYDFILKMVCLQFIRVLERTSPVICNTKRIDKHQKPMCNQYMKTNISTLLNKEYSGAKILIYHTIKFQFLLVFWIRGYNTWIRLFYEFNKRFAFCSIFCN